MPPTPTPLPDMDAPIELDLGQLSVWEFAPDAIGYWNAASEITTTFQAILLFGIILFILFAVYRKARNISLGYKHE